MLETVCEEGEEVFRVLAGEKESLRGAAVTQIVHAGGKFACVRSRSCLIRHDPSLRARVWLFMFLGLQVVERKGEEKS